MTAAMTRENASGQHLIKQEITVEIENESTSALVAEWLTMVVADQD